MKRAAEISTSSLHSDTETVSSDLSILRKPIKTSVNGLLEARKAYDDGTDEVRKLLSNECDIVYECKVCRNLFRSLANFISHKRVYCKLTYCSSLQYDYHNDGKGFSQDISTIVQAEQSFIGTAKNGKNSDKDLSSIVERLIKREKASRSLKLSDFYEQVNSKLTQDELLQQRHVLHLDVVPESNVAVYQTVKSPDDSGDNIKAEVIEIQNISDQSRTVLGPDGKVVNPSDLPEYPDDDNKKLAQPFECEVCSCKFATEKTLKLHIETKHIPSTYVFQCPSCSKTFLQVGQVIRHLTNDHKKSMRRVRLMRDSILKRRTRIDEVQVKGPSRELARLQTDKERVDSQNKAWLDNLENNENYCKNICLYCGRQFDRRAVLFSHHKVCQLKKKPNTRISLTKKVGLDRIASNGWNDREFDDSSNSNSLDGAFMDDSSASATFKEKSKLIKSEGDVIAPKMETDVSESITTTAIATATHASSTNRRKRNRAHKAIVSDEPAQSDDEKSLNIGWKMDETVKIKEESVSPVDDTNLSDSGTNLMAVDDDDDDNDDDNDDEVPAIKTEDVNCAKEEKRTRATNANSNSKSNSNSKIHEIKPKSKLTSSHCKYCFKKFSNASNLRRHITMSHFGPKKFTCNACTFRARRKSDILSHMRTKHQLDGDGLDAHNKFKVINDEPTPKPRQSSFSRRKDKHTEVLRDDEEEIYIDSEAFVLEESSDQLHSLGTSHENSNADNDDESMNYTNETDEIVVGKSNSNLKRKGRPKAKEKAKKFDRSQSPADQKECESLPARRPVRNRIMPVKKDFVYDLSTLLKKDYKDFQDPLALPSTAPQPPAASSPPSSQSAPPSSLPASASTSITSMSTSPSQPSVTQSNKSRNVSPVTVDNKPPSKRRHLLPDASDSSESQQTNADQSKSETQKLPSQQPIQKDEQSSSSSNNNNQTTIGIGTIKGAAETMAKQAVQANRASFFKTPELPTERPVATPQRQFDSSTIKDWPVLKRAPAIFDGLKTKLSTHHKVPGLKRKKRSCILKHGANSKTGSNHKNRLHEKHDRHSNVSTNGHNNDNPYNKCNDTDDQPIPELMKISTKLADKIQLQCAQIESDSNAKVTCKMPSAQTNNAANNAPLETNKSTDVAATTASATATPTTPRRMTLLERLAENKTKKLNESLSRMTIANSDNDSDDE